MNITSSKLLKAALIISISYILIFIFINWTELKQIVAGEPHLDFIFMNYTVLPVIPVLITLIYKTLKEEENKTNQEELHA
jgi:hypothetical protein